MENPSKWGLEGPKILQKSRQMWPGALPAASRAQGWETLSVINYFYVDLCWKSQILGPQKNALDFLGGTEILLFQHKST